MRVGIYAVLDKKAKAFLSPWTAPNDQVAERQVTMAVRDVEHNFHKFPEDYELHHLGWFDDQSGLLEPLSSSNLVKPCLAISLTRDFYSGPPSGVTLPLRAREA